MSLPAAKGFESGSGFAGTQMLGSAHNDVFEPDGRAAFAPDPARGHQGGISNGMPLVRVAFKPVATIFQSQDTVDTGEDATTSGADGTTWSPGRCRWSRP